MADNTKLRIAMFPWLAFGHMIPWLQLAKLIAQKGHEIIFISTSRNIDRLPKLSPTLASFIHFVKLPLPQVENLPENAEATMDLHYDDPPSALINRADHDLNTPEDYTRQPKWVPFPTTVAFRLFEARRVFHAITGDESNVSDFYRIGETLRSCDIIAIRSCVDFGPEWLKVLEDIHRKPVIPIGQLPTTADDGGEETGTWRWIKEWLDKQEKGSVVYLAFGSEAKPNTKLIELPDGFEERTKGRGVVCTSWAPQVKILAHDSVGLIAKQLAEKKIGYVVPREEGDGSFTRDSVAESLRLVVVEEEGKFYREKAMEMKGLFGDRDRQDQYVDNFLNYLESHRCLK
ncbi:hypothetical protein Patl1_28346 [Pistacia atlantica]|uniref:Uncharacterized protein n=1 Tax=Pistacia atlantica TaxID=434234 RepID=A0ACC1BG19_9ROSI|nr:hypothetical protein Patl1_28346 [Pistacia atlantica]